MSPGVREMAVTEDDHLNITSSGSASYDKNKRYSHTSQNMTLKLSLTSHNHAHACGHTTYYARHACLSLNIEKL